MKFILVSETWSLVLGIIDVLMTQLFQKNQRGIHQRRGGSIDQRANRPDPRGEEIGPSAASQNLGKSTASNQRLSSVWVKDKLNIYYNIYI